MRALCFTVDLDRDVNMSIPGQTAAGSLDRGSGTAPRFSSSASGLEMLTDILDDIGASATFFAEGRTLEALRDIAGLLSGHEVGVHGYDHEDIEGMDADGILEVVEKGKAAVRDTTGAYPTSFRAPYMRCSDDLYVALARSGLITDSSTYAAVSGSMVPSEISACGSVITEVPVAEGTDSRGKKIAAYLWPMHEGKRSPDDYLELASRVDEGAFVLATHTWHMFESRTGGVMSESRRKANAASVAEVLDGLIGMGFEPMTVSAFSAGFRARSH
jgi:peptidoglycan-N-acetylglucosamine deacetylase